MLKNGVKGKTVQKEDLQIIVRFGIEYHATFGVPVGPHHTILFKMNLLKFIRSMQIYD